MRFGKPHSLTPWFQYQIQGYSNFDEIFISRKSVLKLFGYSTSASWLAEYLETFQKFTTVPERLISEINNPRILKINSPDKILSEEVYALTTFFALIEFIVHAKAEGYIGLLDLKISTTAENILGYNNKVPLKDAIAETSGQNFYKLQILEKTAKLLEDASGDSSFKWIVSLPVDFIERLFRTANLKWEMGNGLIPALSELLQRIVFNRLPAQISDNLKKQAPKRSYRRKNYKPQALGNDDLAEMLTIIKGLMITANYSESVLYQLLDKIYPVQKDPILKISVPFIQLSEQETEIRKLLF